MTFDTREQARIRRAFDAVLDRVEPAPDLEYLIEQVFVVEAESPQPVRRHVTASSGAVAIIAVALVTAGALWMSSTPTGTREVTTGGEQGTGLTGDTVADPVSSPMGLAEMPILGLDMAVLSGWHSIDAFEEEGPDGGVRGVDYTMTTEDGSGVTAQLRVYGIRPGSEAESAMWWSGREDYQVFSISADDARLFTVDNQHLIVWRPGSPSNALMILSVEAGPTPVTADEAIRIASTVIELHPDAWQELLVYHSEEYAEDCLPEAVGC